MLFLLLYFMESMPAGLPHKLQTSPTVSALSSPAAPVVRRPGPLMKPWPCSCLQVPKVLLIGRNFSAGLLQTVSRIRGSRQLLEEVRVWVDLSGLRFLRFSTLSGPPFVSWVVLA